MVMINAMPVVASEGAAAASSRGVSGISWGVVIIVALIVALIACLIASSSMKSVHKAISAKHYEKEGSFKLSRKNDNYLHTTEQRIHHEPADKS